MRSMLPVQEFSHQKAQRFLKHGQFSNMALQPWLKFSCKGIRDSSKNLTDLCGAFYADDLVLVAGIESVRLDSH